MKRIVLLKGFTKGVIIWISSSASITTLILFKYDYIYIAREIVKSEDKY